MNQISFDKLAFKNHLMKSILFSCVMCLFINLTHGQSHKVNWYFGKGAGLEFGTGNPVATSFGNLNTDEGSATISDQNGKLIVLYQWTSCLQQQSYNHA